MVFSSRVLAKEHATFDRLRELASEEDALILMMEAVQISRLSRKAVDVKMIKFEADVFPVENPSYPVLFSQPTAVTMRRSDLMTEISLIIDMAHRDDITSGTHIYSIQVLEPKVLYEHLDFNTLLEYFEGNLPSDLRSGYLYWNVLYNTPQFARDVVLSSIINRAEKLEIALRNPSTNTVERKIVTLG